MTENPYGSPVDNNKVSEKADYSEMNVRCYFVTLKYKSFLRIQVVSTLLLLMLSAFTYFYRRDNPEGVFNSSWFYILLWIPISFIEFNALVRKAKKKYHEEHKVNS